MKTHIDPLNERFKRIITDVWFPFSTENGTGEGRGEICSRIANPWLVGVSEVGSWELGRPFERCSTEGFR